MMFSDIEYQNDKINNALQHLYIMNEKFNVHFPSLKENLEYYKNKKKCEHLQLLFFFYCIISSILIFNVTIYYNLAILLVSCCFIFIASFWVIIYYYYNHHIVDLPSFAYYLFLINFLIYTIFLLLTPIGTDDFKIFPERIIIVFKIIICVAFFINYFRFSKQIEKEYFFLDILDSLVTEQQIEFEEQDEIHEDKKVNEVQETKQEEVLNQPVPKEIEQNDNQSFKNKRNNSSVNDDLNNMFASIYPVEEAKLHSYVDFLNVFAQKHNELHPFIGKKYNFFYRDGSIVRLDKYGKELIYKNSTIEQQYSKFCNNALS